jgi:hypothetical protein
MANVVHNRLQVVCDDDKNLKEIHDLLLSPPKGGTRHECEHLYMSNFMPDVGADGWGSRGVYRESVGVEYRDNQLIIDYDTPWSPNGRYVAKLFNEKIKGIGVMQYDYWSFESDFGGRWTWDGVNETQDDFESLAEYYKKYDKLNHDKLKNIRPNVVMSFNTPEKMRPESLDEIKEKFRNHKSGLGKQSGFILKSYTYAKGSGASWNLDRNWVDGGECGGGVDDQTYNKIMEDNGFNHHEMMNYLVYREYNVVE